MPSVPTQYTGWAGYFRLRSNLNADWSLGNHGVRWSLRYYSAMYEDCTSNALQRSEFRRAVHRRQDRRPHIASVRTPSTTCSTGGRRRGHSTVSIGVNNVFDKVGPTMYSQPNSSFNYYGGFDIGRFLYVQYQQKF